MSRERAHPIGRAATLEQLSGDPHALLARLRESEPVSWLPSLDGWLLTSHALATLAMRDADRFTVDDPRFSTARVLGPSMLSLDGAEHARHREPFTPPFRPASVAERFAAVVSEEAELLIDGLARDGEAELRQGFAGPLAAIVVARALGLDREQAPATLACYRRIVAAVNEITAGSSDGSDGREAYGELAEMIGAALDGRGGSLLARAAAGSDLSPEQISADAAVLLFGGIETTEGMIANALLHLLERPGLTAAARGDPGLLAAVIEESLRFEPAAAVVDRYATADTALDGAELQEGDLVRISIAAANRDPAVFPDPDEFRPGRPEVRRHLAFAQGPHVCVGVHLARLEAGGGIGALLARLPGLRLDPARPARITGLVFRKPAELWASWGQP